MAKKQDKKNDLWPLLIAILIVLGVVKMCDGPLHAPDFEAERAERARERAEKHYNYTGEDIAKKLDEIGALK